MALEVVLASSPRGLKDGSSGFCVVAATQNVPDPVLWQLESLSSGQGAEDANGSDATPCYSQLGFTAGGVEYVALSRVALMGGDASAKKDRIAHHIVVPKREQGDLDPAWLFAHHEQQALFRTVWEGDPVSLSPRTLANAVRQPGVCGAWKALTGDAGWGGFLVDKASDSSIKHVSVLFAPGTDVLRLMVESLSLLPRESRWQATFSTYYERLPPGFKCAVRFVPHGTAGAQRARNTAAAPVLDLCGRTALGPPPAGPLVQAARTGRIQEKPEKRKPEFDDLDDIVIGMLEKNPPPVPPAPIRRPVPEQPPELPPERAPESLIRRIRNWSPRRRLSVLAALLSTAVLVLACAGLGSLMFPGNEQEIVQRDAQGTSEPADGMPEEAKGSQPAQLENQSVPPADLLAEIGRKKEEGEDLRQEVQQLQDQVLEFEKQRQSLRDAVRVAAAQLDRLSTGLDSTGVPVDTSTQLTELDTLKTEIDGPLEEVTRQAVILEAKRRQAVARLDMLNRWCDQQEEPDGFPGVSEARAALRRILAEIQTEIDGLLVDGDVSWAAEFVHRVESAIAMYPPSLPTSPSGFPKPAFPKPTKEAFADIPADAAYFDLPEPATLLAQDTEAKELCQLYLDAPSRCELQIHGDVLGGGRRFGLSAPRDDLDKREWDVVIQGGLQQARIAVFSLVDQSFRFRWQGYGGRNADDRQLANAALTITAGDRNATVSLRRPSIVDGGPVNLEKRYLFSEKLSLPHPPRHGDLILEFTLDGLPETEIPSRHDVALPDGWKEAGVPSQSPSFGPFGKLTYRDRFRRVDDPVLAGPNLCCRLGFAEVRSSASAASASDFLMWAELGMGVESRAILAKQPAGQDDPGDYSDMAPVPSPRELAKVIAQANDARAALEKQLSLLKTPLDTELARLQAMLSQARSSSQRRGIEQQIERVKAQQQATQQGARDQLVVQRDQAAARAQLAGKVAQLVQRMRSVRGRVLVRYGTHEVELGRFVSGESPQGIPPRGIP
jgi:hypothetical protein